MPLNITLIKFPIFASATASSSCISLDATFFIIFFSDFDILPSIDAVAAIKVDKRYLKIF